MNKKIKLYVFLALSLIVILLPFWSTTAFLDLKLYDTQSYFIREYTAPQKALAKEVVLIGIDEQTYKQFKEPFALWHQHISDLFSALSVSGITVLGFDIAFPDRSYNSIMPGQDTKLLRGMLTLKKKAPFVLGVTREQNGKTREIYPIFLSTAGKKGYAFVLWQLDQDRIIRHYNKNFGATDKEIPTLIEVMAFHQGVEAESGLINYFQGDKISYVPFQDVISWYRNNNIEKLEQHFKGKAVIVGTVLPFEDRHYQPLNLTSWEQNNNNFVPGVLTHVQGLRNLLNNGLISEAPLFLILVINLLLLFLWWLEKDSKWSFVVSSCLSVLAVVVQTVLLKNYHYFFPIVSLLIALFLLWLTHTILNMVEQIMEKQQLRKLFGGYVSPQVMNEIIKGNIKPGIHGERKEICILFSDIRSFTTISENLEPEDIIYFLNQYLEKMTDAIQGNGGTIDKFMGDGIMAFFGAPQPSETAVFDAFNAAKDKLIKLEQLNEDFRVQGEMPEIKIGIGLHFGYAVVGNIGSEQRNEYTAIGDVVNTASRLEGLTKKAGYPVVVSKAVVDALNGSEKFDHIGDMPVKGRAPVDVFGWPAKNKKI